MGDPKQGKSALISDEHLMMAIHQGDARAFNELYQRYHKRLLYYFCRMLGNTEEKAKDFLQDIFVKIIERPDLFDPSRRFSTWLFSVAHNMCKNEYRRMAVRSFIIKEESLERHAEAYTSATMDIRLTAEQIFREIDDLGETEKTAFILYYREDFSLQEIAQVLDLPEGTIKSKLFYIRKKITRKLQIQELK